ncbi:DUF6017 domain-containing protein [Oscillospiraceae bacterium 44-34]
MGWMDRLEQRREVDEAIGYESLCSQFNREDVDEIAELIVDVLCTTRPTLRIGGEVFAVYSSGTVAGSKSKMCGSCRVCDFPRTYAGHTPK